MEGTSSEPPPPPVESNVNVDINFYLRLLKCNTLYDAADAILSEVLTQSGADGAVLFAPHSPGMQELHLALCKKKEMETGIRLEAINVEANSPESFSLERAAQLGTVMHITSANSKMLQKSFAQKHIDPNVNMVSILPARYQKFKGVVELFSRQADHDVPEEEALNNVCAHGAVVISRLLQLATAQSLKYRSEMMMQMVQHISNAPKQADVIELIIQSAKDMLDAQRVTLLLVDYENRQLIITRSMDAEGTKIPLKKSSIAGYVAKTGNALNIPNAYEDDRFDPTVDKNTGFTTKSVLCVPVRDSTSSVVGVIQAINRVCPSSLNGIHKQEAPDWVSFPEDTVVPQSLRHQGSWPFTDEDQTLVMTLAGHAGISLQRIEMCHQSERQREVNSAVLDVVRDVTSETGNLQDLMHRIVNASYRITDAERVTLYLVDQARQELWLAISKDIAGKRIPLGRGIAGIVAQSGETILIRDAYADPRFNVDVDRETGFKTRQILCVPVSMMPSENPIAVLQVINKRNGKEFTEEDCDAMAAFSLEAAVALKRKSMDAIFLRMLQHVGSQSGQKEQVVADSNVKGTWNKAKRLGAHAEAEKEFQVSLLELFSDEVTSAKLHSTIKFSWVSTSPPRKTHEFNETALYSQSSLDSEHTSGPVKTFSFNRNASEYSLLGSPEPSRDDWAIHSQTEIEESDPIFSWETNIFELDRKEMKSMVYKMFQNFGLFNRFGVTQKKFISFVDRVESLYHENPFHNFYHSVSVLHAAFMMVCKTKAFRCLSFLDILGVLIAALCHDIDHPGHSQAYEINIRSALAIRHNDDAVLERHHAHMTFETLHREDCNILGNLSRSEYQHVRKVIITGILGTDMSKHFSLIQKLSERAAAFSEKVAEEFSDADSPEIKRKSSSIDTTWSKRRSVVNMQRLRERRANSVDDTDFLTTLPFDRNVDEHRLLLLEALVHTADLSGQAFPPMVATIWGNAVISEFQQEAEKQLNAGYEPPPFMKNLETELQQNKLQSSFILNIVLPLWEQMDELLQDLNTPLQNLRLNHQLYEKRIRDVSVSSDDLTDES
eukprot:gb/GECG01000421.1/.p1 GENE.gb/GECG01000421.1/~~gb/GECG01000421.1/.p1  ORF type:complete len:1062 (+),score=145.17 gb/GECG01000421.1/:1-3186(+)